jgi:hypothetical protein
MFLVLTLLIGALVGLAVVAFILATERFGARLYPPPGAAWRRLLVPIMGSLGMGYLLNRFFPTRAGAEYRKRKQPYTRMEAGYRSAPCQRASIARRRCVAGHSDAVWRAVEGMSSGE